MMPNRRLHVTTADGTAASARFVGFSRGRPASSAFDNDDALM
jgi:hypothetical protein